MEVRRIRAQEDGFVADAGTEADALHFLLWQASAEGSEDSYGRRGGQFQDKRLV